MGGQACILYGAAEFSRDVDLNILHNDENINNLQQALKELQADVIAVPVFKTEYLQEGLAVHFRCKTKEAEGLRIDIMTKMRNIAPFDILWNRRTTISLSDGDIDVLSLPDLVNSKKTQRDKDWPMIRRLVEVNYFNNRNSPTSEQIQFWILESRSTELLFELSQKYPDTVKKLIRNRPLLELTFSNDEKNKKSVAHAIRKEEDYERAIDAEYWLPLKKKLEILRRQRS